MTKQHNALQAVLDRASANSPVQEITSQPAPKPALKPKSARAETALVGGHFPKAVLTQLRIIAAEEGATNQALLREALDLLFLKYGKRKTTEL